MKRQEFLNLLIEECDIDSEVAIDELTNLKELEDWDSLSFITVLSLFKAKFGCVVTINQLRNCITFKDILDLGNDCYEK